VRLADHGISAATAYGREDLAARLREVRDRASDPTVRIVVAGEFKHGKSSLVNALVGQDVCPVDDDVATAVPTAVAHAPAPRASAIVLGDDGDSLRRAPIDVSSLPAWVTERGEHADPRQVQLVELGVAADALRDGVVLVDLPGVGGLGSAQGAMTRAALPSAHAVLFVTDAAQELVATELEVLETIAGEPAVVALVETKIDIHPAWRSTVEADAATAGELVATVLPVSSELAREARRRGDERLMSESGLDALAAWLRGTVVAGAARREAELVADVVATVAEHLRQRFDAEQSALRGAGGDGSGATSLERAEQELARVRSGVARWQTVFADVFADLSNDLDYGLRSSLRELLRQAEEALDELDPAKSWDSFEPQVRRDLARLVGEHYALVDARLAEAATTVAAVLSDDTGVLDVLGTGWDVSPAAEQTGQAVKAPELKRPGLGGQALTLMRSSTGGAAMAGLLATAVGLPIAAPAVLAAGLALGSRGMRQESQRLLLQRRTQAKAAMRGHFDECSFVVLKDSRDRIRFAQRRLRDFFAGRAGELSTSATETLQAAREATRRDAADRAQRAREVEAELERLAWLADAAAEARRALAGAAVS
jgi:hypothetical protein